MILLALFAAQAATAPECTKFSTQSELNACAAIRYRDADKELNAVWPAARRAMRDIDREAGRYGDQDRRAGYDATLLASQRAWLRYRDAQCALAGYSARGGSMEPMLVNGCKAQLTSARILFLRDLIDGDGW